MRRKSLDFFRIYYPILRLKSQVLNAKNNKIFYASLESSSRKSSSEDA